MTTWRERLERGYGMRVQRLVEGALLAASFVFDDLRPAWVAFALLAAQALVSPVAAPVALAWVAVERRVHGARLGDLYYDMAAVRGASAITCVVLTTAFVLIHFGMPTVGRILIGAPCASCILSATVGFCAGCGYYVVGRDALVRLGFVRGTPQGATDVELEGR